MATKKSNNNDIVALLRSQVIGLLAEYQKQKGVYDNAGMNNNLKGEALNAMANALALEEVAIRNLANWNYALGLSDKKISDKS
jgi:hypothetical protein